MLFFKIFRVLGWVIGFGAIIAHLLHYSHGLDYIFSEQTLLAFTVIGAFADLSYQHAKQTKELNALRKEMGK